MKMEKKLTKNGVAIYTAMTMGALCAEKKHNCEVSDKFFGERICSQEPVEYWLRFTAGKEHWFDLIAVNSEDKNDYFVIGEFQNKDDQLAHLLAKEIASVIWEYGKYLEE